MARIEDSQRVLALLQHTEGLSNVRIKGDLKLSDERYEIVRQRLLAKKLVTKYACRGGGIRLNPKGDKSLLAHNGLPSSPSRGSGLAPQLEEKLIEEAKQRYE